MCLLAVLGIALAGYLAVSNQSMKFSNRSFQTGLSAQLAEMGLEEAQRAFNSNNWATWTNAGTTATWTLSGTTATCNLAFPATKFGQGVTGSIKIRVDNYNANQLNATWSSSTTYRINDLVGYNGTWFRSVRNGNANQTPSTTNLTWWVPNPMPWTWRTNYAYSQYQMVNYKGIWYGCIAAHTSNATTFSSDSASWNAIPTQRAWSSGVAYVQYDVVAYTDPTTSDITLYRCTTAHTSSASFSTDSANWSSNVQTVSLAWSSGTVYTRGAITYYVGASIYTWYYCRQSGTSNTAPNLDTTMWAPVWADTTVTAGAPGDTVVAATKYYVGDYINYSGIWYRCITAHTYNNWASDSANWTSTNALPYLQLFYRSAPSQTSNNIIFYAGSTWYRYMGGWNVAYTGTMHLWSSGSIKYNPGDAVYYSTTARWYRCITAHTSSAIIVPTSTAYWATAPLFSAAWDTGRQYGQNDAVTYNGVWYLSLQNSNYGQNPATATTYWIGANTATASYKWNAASSYSVGDYRCYGGVWYKCLSAGANKSPNDSTYWTASWANAWGVTTGAPVIYAEGTMTLPDNSAPIKTQLRATIAPAPLFPNAVAATTTISANSGGTVDSYDSTASTPSSTQYTGQVDTSTNFSAVVASTDTSGGTAITLASTTVKGYLAAPSSSSTPFAPLYSSGGSVKGFTSPGAPSIDLTHVSRSPYIPQFDTLPAGAGSVAANWANLHKGTALSLTSPTTNVGTAGDTTPSRYYYNGNLTIGTASIQYLNINGPVILYINGDLFITASGSTGRININNTGSAEIHVAGAFKADVGGEGTLSYTYDPKTFVVICDTTSSADHFYSEGVYPLYGVVYAPYTTSTNGYYNSNNSTNIYGAVSAKKITYSGANMNVHYDTSLRYALIPGVDQPYAITEWRELTDPAEKAILP